MAIGSLPGVRVQEQPLVPRCAEVELASTEIVPWRTRAGDVDVLLGIPSTSRYELARYEELLEDATIVEVDGFRVAVASLADIIHLKQVADRPKDRQALEELRVIEDRHRRARNGPRATKPRP